MTKNNKKSFVGLVMYRSVFIGSKSAHRAIVLKTDEGKYFRLRVQGDNPFENNLLKPFVGKRVRMDGFPLSSTPMITLHSIGDITVLGPPVKKAKPPQP